MKLDRSCGILRIAVCFDDSSSETRVGLALTYSEHVQSDTAYDLDQ